MIACFRLHILDYLYSILSLLPHSTLGPERKINGTQRDGAREESEMENLEQNEKIQKKFALKNKNTRNGDGRSVRMRKPPRLPRCGMDEEFKLYTWN